MAEAIRPIESITIICNLFRTSSGISLGFRLNTHLAKFSAIEVSSFFIIDNNLFNYFFEKNFVQNGDDKLKKVNTKNRSTTGLSNKAKKLLS